MSGGMRGGARAGGRRTARGGAGLVTIASTIGVVAAGVALLEVALIPGMVIGGAAVLGPRYLPRLRPRVTRLVSAARAWRPQSANIVSDQPTGPGARTARGELNVTQALFKTITYRVIVTALDFTTNYLIIGEFGAAAGLSAFGLITGPVVYFLHETSWNYLGARAERGEGAWGTTIKLPALMPGPRDGARDTAARERRGFTINQSLAKTITFRVLATAIEFTAAYVVVGNVATAAGLSAVGFVVGPFVYLGHELAWDRFATRSRHTVDVGYAAA